MSELKPLKVGKSSDYCQVDQRRRCQSKPLRECNLYLLQEGTFSDVTFIVGPTKKRIPCHQLILKSRSPVFEVMFSDRWNQDGIKEVSVEDIDPTIFQMFLQYIYADTFVPNVSESVELLQVAHRYDVQLLVNKCEELLEGEATLDDAVDVFQAARTCDRFALMEKVGDLMATSLSELINRQSFSRVDKQTLMYVLKRSDLKMKEIDLFRLAAQWAKYHYGAHAHENLEDILPLIRFPIMTLEDFTTTVVPTGLHSQSTLIDLFTYFGTNVESRKPLASALKFSTEQRAIDNRPKQARQPPSSVPVELYPRYLSNFTVKRKYKQLFEQIEMCISVLDNGVSLSTGSPALPSSEPDRKYVVLSGMSLYCPMTTANLSRRMTAPSIKEFKILVQAKNSYCEDYKNVFTLSPVTAEEGKMSEVDFDAAVPLDTGKYFRFIVKEIPRTRRVGGQDYEVKDFGSIPKSAIKTVGDSRVLVACTTYTSTSETNGRYANPKLIHKISFKEC